MPAARPLPPAATYLVGIALFCGMDAVVKHLLGAMPVATVTFWRYAVASLFMAGAWLAAGRPAISGAMWRMHALRGAFIAVTALAFFWSLARLRLAETVTIAFIAPLLVPPLASLFLRERMRASALVAGLIGFGGAVIAVAGGDLATITPGRIEGAAAALLSACAYAVSVVMMRDRAQKDDLAIIGLLGALLPMVYVLPIALVAAPGAFVPASGLWGWMLLMGAFGAGALQFYASAYARAQAQVLAPLEYSALPWAALIGWFAFAEPLRPQTWAGAALIMLACLWSTWRAAPSSRPV